MIIKSIMRIAKSARKARLTTNTIPWAALLLCFGFRQVPYTREYSSFSILNSQPVPWEIWYCTEDTIGNEGKIFAPNNPAYILFGGAKNFRSLTQDEENSTIKFPPAYCSVERFEDLALPDSLHLIWGAGEKTQEKWVPVKPRLTPKWGSNREYNFALRTRYSGQIDFYSDSDSLSRYIEVRNMGFGKRLPENEPTKPHSSVW
ncbi:MAG: hypothetical protein IPK50_08800 [Fibrobacterota bacterium]|nr:hypothetical protein [Fibrobacterota bacterium]QQS06980.1 MAG: hypothetical protein IPK50_08800 [Fibrobacterota bacterium]